MAALFAGSFATIIDCRTCYDWSINDTRSPGLTRDYAALVQKYRDNGIIKDETCAKLLKALGQGRKGLALSTLAVNAFL